MARRIPFPRPTRAAFAAAGLLALSAVALAQPSPAPTVPAPATPSVVLSKSCQQGASALAGEMPLPNVAAALAKRKTLRILTMGSAPGRIGAHGGTYTGVIETMLESALKGIDVEIINRG